MITESVYRPYAPYVFKTGKRKGVSLEKLMFYDYSFLVLLKKTMKEKSGENYTKNKNQLEGHLEWLLARGENRETKMYCPYCRKTSVEYFSIRYSANGNFSLSPNFIACENCKENLLVDKKTQLFPFKFSVLAKFRRKGDQKRIGKLFQKVFGLSSRLRKEKIFEFFSE